MRMVHRILHPSDDGQIHKIVGELIGMEERAAGWMVYEAAALFMKEKSPTQGEKTLAVTIALP